MPSASATPAEETILAFDFGEKRIGVAVGNTVSGRAQALTTLHVASNAERLDAVGRLVEAWQPARLVVGEPQHEDGRAHEIAHLAHKFGNRLQERFRLPVEYVNEFLTSAEAERTLAERGIRGIAQKAYLDAAAAEIILQNYLDLRHAA